MTTKRLGLAAPLALAAALTLAAPAGAAGLPTDLWQRAWGWLAGLRVGVGELVNVWAEQGAEIDPNGAPAPRPTAVAGGMANAWVESGGRIDPQN